VHGVLTSTILDVTTGAARVFLWRRLLVLLLLGTAAAAATVAGSPLSSMRASAAGCMASSTTLMKKTKLTKLRPEAILCGVLVERGENCLKHKLTAVAAASAYGWHRCCLIDKPTNNKLAKCLQRRP
jgi:hypothetical protein